MPSGSSSTWRSARRSSSSTSSDGVACPARGPGRGHRPRRAPLHPPRLVAAERRRRRSREAGESRRSAHRARLHARAPRPGRRARAVLAPREGRRAQPLGVLVHPLQGRGAVPRAGAGAPAATTVSSWSVSTPRTSAPTRGASPTGSTSRSRSSTTARVARSTATASTGFPETFVIDREGRVVAAFAGAVNGEEERARLASAIDEALST